MNLQDTSKEIWQSKYQLKDDQQHPVDQSIDDSFKRVAEALSQSEENQPYWYNAFYEAINKGATPAGRILANAGAEKYKSNVSLINCLAGDTPVLTKNGMYKIKDLAGMNVEVLNGNSEWTEAPFMSFGEQDTYKVTLCWGDNKRNTVEVYATKDHRWFLTDGRVVTTEFWLTGGLNKNTCNIPHMFVPEQNVDLELYEKGVIHGMVYGDGSKNREGKFYLNLCGDKREELTEYVKSVTNEEPFVYENNVRFNIFSETELKDVPKTMDYSYLRGFFAGILSTDGTITRNGNGCEVSFSGSKELIDFVNNVFPYIGVIPTYTYKSYSKGEDSNYGTRNKDIWRVGVHAATVSENDILRDTHKQKFVQTGNGDKVSKRWQVVSIDSEPVKQEVFCCTEPETTAFAIFNGMKTGQCTVSQTVHDNIDGIMEGNKKAAMTLAGGSGIGYEFSTLRPSGSFVKGAGAFTSGPLSFMDIYDSMCFTISSAGGRRGAQMATFYVWHPDVYNFIRVKRENGRLRQFNLSLLVDDELIEAVKNDEQYPLRFPVRQTEIDAGYANYDELVERKNPWYDDYVDEMGYLRGNNGGVLFKVYEWVNAKELWDTIMTSTYDFSEPGIILVDRVNDMNNNWFCERITASNPCVTGETKILTDDGYVRIDSVIGENVNIWNGFEWSEVTPRITGYDQEIMEVNFDDGTTIHCTPYHEFILSDGNRVEARNLSTGMKMQKHEFPVIEGNEKIDSKVAYTQGFYSGDRKKDSPYLWLYDDKVSFQEHMILKSVIGPYGDGEKYMATMSESPLGENFVPGSDWDKQSRLDWFAGLLDSDGMNGKDGSLQITSVEYNFLQEVKDMLNTLGIPSKVRFNKETDSKMMPDGKGGQKEYNVKECWRLLVSGWNVSKLRELGLVTHRVDNNYQATRDSGDFVKVEAISYRDGLEDQVYCVTEPKKNSVVFQGLMTGNCGEQMLPPNGSCLLGSVNVARFIKNEFEPDAYFDWDSYKDVVRIFTRMLDNVVEYNGLPLEEQQDEIFNKRRHGMGILGIGSLFSMLGIQYGDDESVELTEELTKQMAIIGFEEGVKLAREKGPAPILKSKENRRKWAESEYMKQIWAERPELKELALEYGCRFTHHTSVAPTGTIALSVNNNVSNGIEPTFSNHYYRNVIREGKKTKDQVSVWSYEMLLYKEKFNTEEIPDWFSIADNVSIDGHVAIQAAAQKWVDSSISKTVNVPSDIAFEDFKNLYMDGYEKGLKGITSFRFNPEVFTGVLVREDDLDNTTYVFETDDGETIKAKGSDVIEYDGEEHNAANLFDAIKENTYGKY